MRKLQAGSKRGNRFKPLCLQLFASYGLAGLVTGILSIQSVTIACAQPAKVSQKSASLSATKSPAAVKHVPSTAQRSPASVKNSAGSLKGPLETTIKNAWKLDQRSRVLGDQTVFVCPIGVKAVSRKDGLTLVCVEPFTEVVTYSTRTGKVCRQTFANSDNPYAKAVAMLSGVSQGEVRLSKKRDYSKDGLLWTEFKIADDYKKERMAMFRRKEVTSSEPAYGNLVGFHLPMDQRLVDWMARLYCVPKTGTVPFDVTFWDVDNDMHTQLKTFKMVPASLTRSDFKCPSGLHPVRDPRTVIQDESATDAIEMMMGGSK